MDAITKDEIVKSIAPVNGKYFRIDNPDDYAQKIITLGKALTIRDSDKKLMSYILYYDNMPDIFISMIWTREDYRGRGYARSLIKELIAKTSKDITLEVSPDNPAKNLYSDFKFNTEGVSQGKLIMRYPRRLAIMQPYIFPYVGYFNLIEASDKFIFYDDTNYINKGWINRNRILMNNSDLLFTIPLEKASQNRQINDIKPIIESGYTKKFFSRIEHSYKKAPYYSDTLEVLNSVFASKCDSIADLAINSVVSVFSYLGKDIRYTKSSLLSPPTIGMEKSDRLIQITKNLNYDKYINSIGGQDLYDKVYFNDRNIKLDFIRPELVEYKQFGDTFVPWLSVIDILMFNDKQSVKKMFNSYSII
ncbi:WbqC family protein [Bacteroidales bacterium MB20-C3-3]|nr:WbqC family protein [Bacteroidales bacterium MB20-C3-3]